TIKAGADTGISKDFVFYFGNAAGESGNSSSDAIVNATDEIGARNDPHKSVLNPADITNVHDYNRDGLVNATDEIIARNNSTSILTALKLIAAPATAGSSPNNSATAASSAPFSDRRITGAWLRSVV